MDGKRLEPKRDIASPPSEARRNRRRLAASPERSEAGAAHLRSKVFQTKKKPPTSPRADEGQIRAAARIHQSAVTRSPTHTLRPLLARNALAALSVLTSLPVAPSALAIATASVLETSTVATGALVDFGLLV